MAVRIRTPQYIKIRDGYRASSLNRRDISSGSSNGNHREISKVGLLDGERSPDIELDNMKNLPPDWLGRVSNIQYDLQKIRNKMGDLSELHRKHLLPAFDDRTDQEHAIEILTADITKMFHQCQNKIKSIGEQQKLKQEEEQMKGNIKSNLASQLQELSVQFRKNQKSYLQSLRRMQVKNKAGSGASGFIDLMDEKEMEEYTERGFTADQLRQVEQMGDRVSQREKDILQIAKSINELAEIFKDLQLLVIDQGTILDRIDYNIETTSSTVDESIVELRQANNEQKKMRTKLCMLLLLILIFCMIVIVLIKGVAFPKH
eukprot:TRINITY_DN4866_c0_g1_i2.p1 TRINITY_DN4866_c0_g1~~TRINITY_DN4866_c0_g1_i2.p1  ORF type:complete len:317 (-),score=52.11 TRINITY_DN4866_c0_g1_i2:69-1019(-)